MMRSSCESTLFGFIILATVYIRTGDSIRCHVCNSATDSRCADPFATSVSSLLVKDCDDYAQLYNKTTDWKYTRCLKMMQTVSGNSRVVRGCSTTGSSSPGCISRTGTSGVKISYCQCVGDSCNGSVRHGLSNIGLVLAVPSILLLRLLATTVYSHIGE